MSYIPGGIARSVALVLLVYLHLCAQTPQPNGERSLDWGFEQRVRNENWDNIMDYNDGMNDLRNQVRYRTRLWVNAPVTHDIDIFMGLDQETNQIIRTHQPWRMDEVIFENAYVDFKKLFVKGLSLRVGRQNLIRGEGFLMLEGNCYDGSRSIYMNAADLASIAARARQADDALAGGASTVTISTTAIIIGLLVLILLIVALR